MAHKPWILLFVGAALSQPVWSQSDLEGFAESAAPTVTTGVGGGAALAAIVKTYLNFSGRDLLIEKSSRVIYRGGATPMTQNEVLDSASRINEGDMAVVQYELSEIESRAVHVGNLQSELAKQRDWLPHYKEQWIQAMQPTTLTESFPDHQGQIKSRKVTKVDLNKVAALQAKIDRVTANISELEALLADVVSGTPVRGVPRIAEVEDARQLEKFLLERMSTGNQVTTIRIVPRETVTKVKGMTRGGWIGIAAAVFAGGATGLELLSGHEGAEQLNVRVFQPAIQLLENLNLVDEN